MLRILSFKKHPEKNFKIDKQIVKQLNYDKIEFPVQEKDFNKIEMMNNVCIIVFAYDYKLVFPIYILDQNFRLNEFIVA